MVKNMQPLANICTRYIPSLKQWYSCLEELELDGKYDKVVIKTIICDQTE